MKKAEIKMFDLTAGYLIEDEDGYSFTYTEDYLDTSGTQPISLTLPIQREPYKSKTMFPFFDGLIPEGWLLDIAEKNWKLNPRDRFGLLLACCKDCIGAVSIIEDENNEN
ncbi:HipA N-terminal domain-containing protein [soil metagenome]